MAASPQVITTPLTKLFKIKHPVMLAGQSVHPGRIVGAHSDTPSNVFLTQA
jgi:hypothetical protein